MQNDIPYIESLLLFLRKDTELLKVIKKTDLFAKIELDQEEDCKTNTSVFILPGQSIRKTTGPVSQACGGHVEHTLQIAVAVQCIRDEFIFNEKDGQVTLEGEMMKLAKIRKAILAAVARYNKAYVGKPDGIMNPLVWDRTTPADKTGNFIISALEFKTEFII